MSAKGGLFGANVNPRERAAHIACAVVLTIVVLGVIVALIVYFTTGDSGAGNCANKDAGANDEPVVPPADPTGNGPENTGADVRRVVKQSPVRKAAQPARLAASNGQFRQASGLMDAVQTNSQIQPAQGVTQNVRMAGYAQSVQDFNSKYGSAMSAMSPARTATIEDTGSHHKNYFQNRPDLSDQYTDANLMAKWNTSSTQYPFHQSQEQLDYAQRNQVPGVARRM